MADANPTTPKKNQYLNNPERILTDLIGAGLCLGGARTDEAMRYRTLIPHNIAAAEAMLRRLADFKSQIFLVSEVLSKLTWVAAQNEEVRREMADDIYGLGMAQHYLTRLVENADFEHEEIAFVLRESTAVPIQ